MVPERTLSRVLDRGGQIGTQALLEGRGRDGHANQCGRAAALVAFWLCLRPRGPLSPVLAGWSAAGASGRVPGVRGAVRGERLSAAPGRGAGVARGAGPIRVLHISDLHLTPAATARQTWVSRLAALEPDLVVNTGDNLAHLDAVPFVLRSLGRLLDVPGVFVWGSNDYFAPTFKNPLRYLTGTRRSAPPRQHKLPWEDLGRAFTERGWVDLTHERSRARGARRPVWVPRHRRRASRARPLRRGGRADRPRPVDVALGVTHAPYRRVLDAMTADGHDLILAGHTHGGQVCVPGLRGAGHQLRPRPGRGSRACPPTARPATPPGCTSRPDSAPPRTRRSASPAPRRRPCSPWSPRALKDRRSVDARTIAPSAKSVRGEAPMG